MPRVKRTGDISGWVVFPETLTLIEAGKEYTKKMGLSFGAKQSLDLQLDEYGQVFTRVFVVKQVIECVDPRGEDNASTN